MTSSHTQILNKYTASLLLPLLVPRNDSLDFHALLAVLHAAEIQADD